MYILDDIITVCLNVCLLKQLSLKGIVKGS